MMTISRVLLVSAIISTPEMFVKRRFCVSLNRVFTERVSIILVMLTIFVIVDPTDFTSEITAKQSRHAVQLPVSTVPTVSTPTTTPTMNALAQPDGLVQNAKLRYRVLQVPVSTAEHAPTPTTTVTSTALAR